MKTWTWEGDGRSTYWPQDFLHQACPTARILSFGYNADFAHFYPFIGPKFISENLTIDDHTTAMFQSLIGLREKTKTVRTGAFCVTRQVHAHDSSISRQNDLLFLSRTV